ncbi:MAG TPA: hypothetical protein VIP07_08090 [Candidatus Limnocylindria bacterium]|jgi:hypothetical protein
MSSHHDEDHPIHLPAPSFSPPLLGFGVMLLAFGVLLGPVFLVLGAIVMVIGLATWLIDDARAYSTASDTDGAHH